VTHDYCSWRRRRTAVGHCNAGVNRSPTVAIAYLCWIKGWTLQAATRHVEEHHPCDPYVEAIERAAEDRRREGPQDSQ
jgi:protein-tyrosine phosphatase